MGYALDAELCRYSLFVFGIHLQHDELSGHVLRDRFYFGRDRFARPAPIRPEIDQDRHAGILNHVAKCLCVRFDRAGHRRQRSFA